MKHLSSGVVIEVARPKGVPFSIGLDWQLYEIKKPKHGLVQFWRFILTFTSMIGFDLLCSKTENEVPSCSIDFGEDACPKSRRNPTVPFGQQYVCVRHEKTAKYRHISGIVRCCDCPRSVRRSPFQDYLGHFCRITSLGRELGDKFEWLVSHHNNLCMDFCTVKGPSGDLHFRIT